MITDAVVGKGYAEASSTLNVFGNNCNDLLASETMMMVKERFIKAYGKPLFTFGRGGSGGSYQQIQTADNYPGLLDGITRAETRHRWCGSAGERHQLGQGGSADQSDSLLP
jgi:hypothetical protein